MEKPLFVFKNRLRNIFTIVYWTLIFICLIVSLLNLYSVTYFTDFWNFIALLVGSGIMLILQIPIKLFSASIYIDVIVFKEWGPHPLLGDNFGVAFENIKEYKIRKIRLGLYWIVLKRVNGKTIQRLFSFSNSELSEFKRVLNEKTIPKTQ